MSQEYVPVALGWVWHPKVIGLSLPARGLWISGLCFAGTNDGHVTRAAALLFAPRSRLAALTSELEAAGLWEPDDTGWNVHDYHEHCAWLSQRREKDRERQRRRRETLGQSRDRPELSRDSNVTVTPERINGERERRTVTPKPPNGAVGRVWETWLESTGRTACKLDDKRKRVIGARLADYPEADVLDAVRGWERDPWDGRRQQNGIEILLRDAAHLEKFRDLWRQPVVVKPSELQSTGELGRLETMQRGISERNDPALADVVAAISAKMRPPEEAFG